ncbi:MAG: DUF2079 domain-containing protein [Candidatus Methylomirabilia bacterium]
MNRIILIRCLDGLTVLLLGLLIAVVVTGGWTVPVGPWQFRLTRPEDAFLAMLPALALRWGLRPPVLPPAPPRWTLAGGVAAYTAIFSFITVTNHYVLHSGFDLGYYVQLLWNLVEGHGPRVSLPEMHAWGDHFSPILYLFMPLFALFPGAVCLLIAQSAALALGAPVVFALARRWLGDDRKALALAGLYLLNPSVHGINLKDFHPQALAIPLLLAAILAFESHRPVWFMFSVVLTLGTREDAGLAILGLGLWLGLARRRWLWGLGVGALGLAWLFFMTWWLIPFFREAPYPHLGRFAHLGGSLGEILLALLRQPLAPLAALANGDRFIYLLALLAPLGFLPLLRPLDLIPALPTLVVNLLSSDPLLVHHRWQYVAYIVPFVFAAAIGGLGRLGQRPGTLKPGRAVRLSSRRALGLALVLSLALTSRTLNYFGVARWALADWQRAVYRLMARVPPGTGVSTHINFIPHLALRSKVFVFPVGLKRSDYVLLYARGHDSDEVVVREGNTVSIQAGKVIRRYAVVTEEASYLLLRRLPAGTIR